MVSGSCAVPDGLPSSPDSTANTNAEPCVFQALQHVDFRDFLQHFGIDPRIAANSLMMVAAHHMFAAPLPPEWTEHFDQSSSRPFFFNGLTGASSWAHPQEKMFRDVLREVRHWRPGHSLEHIHARSQRHLHIARQLAQQALTCWSGPHCLDAAAQGPAVLPEEASHYFFNRVTGESCWIDPRMSVEFDLTQRQCILRACIVEHAQAMAARPSSDSSDGRETSAELRTATCGAPKECPGVALRIPERKRLEPLPVPTRSWLPEAVSSDLTPSQTRSRVAALRPFRASCGDDSVRSCMSYVSACSNLSDEFEEDKDFRVGTPRLGGA